MAILGLLLMLAGLIVGLIYGIQILVLAFKKHILWGLGSLFVPFVGLVFVIKYWEETKAPFLRYLISVPLWILGMILSAMGASEAS